MSRRRARNPKFRSVIKDAPEAMRNRSKGGPGQNLVPAVRQSCPRPVELLSQAVQAHFRLGAKLETLGDWDAAALSYRRAVAIAPDCADLHAGLGRLQCKQGDFGGAVESCRRALALAPNRHEIHNLLGHALINVGAYAAAVESYRHALVLKPDSAGAVYGLGCLFERQGDLASAAESYRLVIKLDARIVEAHLHLGITHFLQGALEPAVECFQRVRELAPDHAEARTFLAHIDLLQGNFARGWAEHEGRWSTPHFLRHPRKFAQPLWKGEVVDRARILLHAEQGLGDTLQFVRYAPLVAARGGNVILEVQPRLHRLLARTPGAGRVLCRGESLPEFDWQCPLMSLPLAFATDLHSIPTSVPYVHPDASLVEAWRQRLAGDSLRVGLAWGGNPVFPHERWRSIPLELLAPLAQLADTTFYSLQMGPQTRELRHLRTQARIIDLQDQQEDLADTAAIIANLQLVISIDTSIAHLAGAMGKPVWILLHKSPDWRWLLNREDSPWYPTARLFRQRTLGDWTEVAARLERELRELIAGKTVEPQCRGP